MSNLTHIDKKLVAISLGINRLPQSTQDDVFSRLEAVILSRLAAKVGSLLSDEERKKIETGNYTESIKKRIANFDEIVKKIAEEAVDEFRQKLSTRS